MEQCNLSTPEVYPPPGAATNFWRVDDLRFVWSSAIIKIGLLGANGERRTETYTGAIATTLMSALNTTNLSVKSLHRRILERLLADGKLTGTISGTP